MAQAFHERLRELLDKRGPDATQAWLSERSGVDRSLISRLLSGDRAPTTATLASIAPALEVTIEALIAGTDAEGRLEDASSTVRRSDYQAVVAKLIEFEAENGDLRRRLGSTKDANLRCEETLRKAEQRAAEASGEASRAHSAKRDLEEQLAHTHAELKRYQQALAKAVAEFDGLRAQVAALQKELGDAKASSKVAAVLAGIGAVAGVATLSRFMERDEDEGPEPDSSRTRRKRR